jgi:hypothetical protein
MAELRLPAEEKYAKELEALEKADKGAKPPQWRLSPKSVEAYIMGSDSKVGGVEITPKYIGDRSLIQVAIATLASDRALMLAGEPGTAKSWLSEHLSAAIAGCHHGIHGGAATCGRWTGCGGREHSLTRSHENTKGGMFGGGRTAAERHRDCRGRPHQSTVSYSFEMGRNFRH